MAVTPGWRKGAPSSLCGRVYDALSGLWDPRRRDPPGNYGDLWPLDIGGSKPPLIGMVAGVFALIPGWPDPGWFFYPLQMAYFLQRPDSMGNFSRHLVFFRDRQYRQCDPTHVD